MKQMPQIQKYMTPMPHTIGSDIRLDTAQSMMRDLRIRHLPVLEASNLVGVLTDRDVKLASGFNDVATLRVEDVMTSSPFTVTPETSLNRVVTEMAEHKFGCAVIRQDNGKVVGVFTAVDALRVLSELLEASYKEREI